MWGLLGLWAFKHPSLYRGVRVQRPAGGRCRWSCSRCWQSATSTPFTGGRTAAAAACCGIPGGTEGCLPLPGHGCDVQPPALFPAHPAPCPPACLPACCCSELRSIHLRTLNKERAEIIAQHWLQEGHVPSPRQVRREEALGHAAAPAVTDGGLRLVVGPIWACALLSPFGHALADAVCGQWARGDGAQLPLPCLLLQVSEEERFVLPPHIEGRCHACTARCLWLPLLCKHPMSRQSYAAFVEATSSASKRSFCCAVGRMPMVISSLDQTVHSSQDLQLFEQPR
jgi:hypothetical protein